MGPLSASGKMLSMAMERRLQRSSRPGLEAPLSSIARLSPRLERMAVTKEKQLLGCSRIRLCRCSSRRGKRLRNASSTSPSQQCGRKRSPLRYQVCRRSRSSSPISAYSLRTWSAQETRSRLVRLRTGRSKSERAGWLSRERGASHRRGTSTTSRCRNRGMLPSSAPMPQCLKHTHRAMRTSPTCKHPLRAMPT